MNFRKGIFRIFLVISGLWFILFAGIAYGDRNHGGSWWLISVGVGVPVVVYLLGKWITDGFFGKKK